MMSTSRITQLLEARPTVRPGGGEVYVLLARVLRIDQMDVVGKVRR